MGYYAAMLYMLDPEKNKVVLPRHIEYLDRLDKEGKVFARGPFADGSGGLVIYLAESLEEAAALAENDPHVVEKVRRLELKKWNVLEQTGR
ncbi:MAG TPA: hypothetical protein DEO65_00185 [Bacillus bacterium]|uniref:YciI family protein n=1 Tax=Siminovitchia fordii TaxID=254759 RepID=UPI00036ED7F1|nr:YciI family protein [Siminovitchia fordii]HBZ08284.1 hypothetical protein [Bacillus sp. (in: firmicutes)]